MDLASALALAAQLVASPAPKPTPRAVSAVAAVEVAAKSGCWVRRDVAGLAVDFGVDFTPESDARLTLREGGRTLSFTTAELEAGAVARFPEGEFPLRLSQGVILAGPIQLKLDDLLLAAYQRAWTVKFGPVVYALELQGAPAAPGAVITLRRDASGMFWIAYHPASELKRIVWLLGVDGTLFGMRLDGPSLSFWSEPVPPIKARPALVADRRLPTF